MNAHPLKFWTPSACHKRSAKFLRAGNVVHWSACLLLLVAPWQAVAHDPGLSGGQLRIMPGCIETELTFARADIESLVRLDTDRDGKVSEAEWAAARDRLAEVTRDALHVRVDQKTLPPTSSNFFLDATNNFHLIATFPARPGRQMVVTSSLIGRLPHGHRQFVIVHDGTNLLVEVLLSSAQNSFDLNLRTPGRSATFREFIQLGVRHIVTGYDHLLFLFALLIVVPNFRNAALIITCFTFAHSITLGVATLNWVNVDSRFVEPLIAATIVYVGVENLFRADRTKWRWLLTFAFGLIHGFGFASVLRELGVTSGTTGIAIPLFSFNLGVELGQIAIAAVVLPVILGLRSHPVFLRRWVPACSFVVIGAGACWLVQRSLIS